MPRTTDTSPVEPHDERGEYPDEQGGYIDGCANGEPRVLLVRLAREVPTDLAAWMDRQFEVESVNTAMSSVERVQAERYELILIYLRQRTVVEAFEALRVLRGLTASPIFLVTDDVIRASDRSRAIKLGAGDYMSGPLHIAELASRAEKVIVAGAPPGLATATYPAAPAHQWTVSAMDGSDADSFAETVRRRLDHPTGEPFTFMRISASGTPDACARVGEVIGQEIRSESGDLVGEIAGGYGVLLNETEPNQAGRLLERVHAGLLSTDVWLQSEALSSTQDGPRIRERLEGAGELT